MGVPRNRLQLRNTVHFKRSSFFDPCDNCVRFYGVTDRSLLLLLVDQFGPIRETFKSTVAAKGMTKKMKIA